MLDRKYYKTQILVEIVSEEPIDDGIGLGDLVRDCVDGPHSFEWNFVNNSEVITGQHASSILQHHGSDPEFFRLDDKGNELD